MNDSDLMRLKVLADYDCWPIWHDGGEKVGPIDPASLAISGELVDAFNRWQAEFDASLNHADPAASSLADPVRFEHEGRRLARALQQELGPGSRVRYWKDQPFE